jgi:hypothetical protein
VKKGFGYIVAKVPKAFYTTDQVYKEQLGFDIRARLDAFSAQLAELVAGLVDLNFQFFGKFNLFFADRMAKVLPDKRKEILNLPDIGRQRFCFFSLKALLFLDTPLKDHADAAAVVGHVLKVRDNAQQLGNIVF